MSIYLNNDTALRRAAAVNNTRAAVNALEQIANGKHVPREVLATLAFDLRDSLSYILEIAS